jgi:hypothetical protein
MAEACRKASFSAVTFFLRRRACRFLVDCIPPERPGGATGETAFSFDGAGIGGMNCGSNVTGLGRVVQQDRSYRRLFHTAVQL